MVSRERVAINDDSNVTAAALLSRCHFRPASVSGAKYTPTSLRPTSSPPCISSCSAGMPSTPPPGRKYFTFFTLDTVLQSAFLFALSAFVHILGVSAGRPNRRVVSLDDELRLGVLELRLPQRLLVGEAASVGGQHAALLAALHLQCRAHTSRV